MTNQPTHHGFAVNVKDYSTYFDVNRGALSEDDVEAIYNDVLEAFWDLAQDIAREHGFRGVYSEGRMGGWAQPYPQPCTDDMYESEIAAWVRNRFRPFERALLALVDDCRQAFLVRLAFEVDRADREPVERAHWEARDVQTI